MYGAPDSILPTSVTFATCSLFKRTDARASRRKRSRSASSFHRGGQYELDRDLLIELDVRRGDDDPHAAHAEHALDAVLAGEDVAFAYGGFAVGGGQGNAKCRRLPAGWRIGYTRGALRLRSSFIRFGRVRRGAQPLWLVSLVSLVSPLAAGCDKDEAPRPKQVPPASPSAVASALGVDAAAFAEVVDPPAPAGDLRAEIDRFTTLDACVTQRSALDPLLADALTAIGYDTFVVDACRVLDAAKAKDPTRCAPIAASSLRARCERVTAIAAADPDLCPWAIASRTSSGRDPLCLALALRDARMCAGALRTERPTCEAALARDEKKCDALTRDPERASCRREMRRYEALVADKANAPNQHAAATTPSTPVPAASAKLDLHALDGTTDAVAESTDVTEDVARGVVLLVQRDGARFDVGDLREQGTGFIAPSPVSRAHFGVALYALTGIKDARVEKAELAIPGAATLLTPGQRANLHVTVTKLEAKRGGEVVLAIDGEMGSSPHGFKLRVQVTTFVRDVVKPTAASSLPLAYPPARSTSTRDY